MPCIVETKLIRTEQRFRLELDGNAIRDLLIADGHDIPPDAEIEFHVPGGADYSNMALDIDDQTPVHVTWTRISQSTE
jgi:hypothetical protein